MECSGCCHIHLSISDRRAGAAILSAGGKGGGGAGLVLSGSNNDGTCRADLGLITQIHTHSIFGGEQAVQVTLGLSLHIERQRNFGRLEFKPTPLFEHHHYTHQRDHPRGTTMARKSQRLSAGAATTLPSHKRAASNTSLPAGEAKKSKTQKATPTKSQYFSKTTGSSARSKKKADDSGDELAPDDDDDEDELASAPEDDLSEFGSAHDSDDAEDDDDNEEDESESEVEESKSRRKSSSKKAATGKSKTVSGGELWREGVKTGLGPGQQVVIKKPKARPAGKVPYSDGSIHPNTLLFLKDLKGNNNREWLKSEFDYCCLLSFLHTALVSGHTECPTVVPPRCAATPATLGLAA
jgi:hypothetical protein